MDSDDDEIECLGTIKAQESTTATINSISDYRETQHLKYQQQTCNNGLICPSHYDPEVFNNLPLDLQQEVVGDQQHQEVQVVNHNQIAAQPLSIKPLHEGISSTLRNKNAYEIESNDRVVNQTSSLFHIDD